MIDIMKCDSMRERLEDVALGAVAALDFETHVAACPDCAAHLAELSGRAAKLDERMDRLVNVETPAGLSSAIAERIRASAPRRAINKLAVASTAAYAALAVAVGGLFLGEQRVRQSEYDHSVFSAAAAISQWRSPTDDLLVNKPALHRSSTPTPKRGSSNAS